MRIEHLLIGVAIFIAVLSLGISMYAEQTNLYNLNGDDDLFSGLNLTSIEDNYESTEGTLRDSSLAGGSQIKDEDTESSIYKEAIGQVRKIGTSVSDTGKIVNAAGRETNLVPSFIIDLLIRGIIILAVAFVIYMIARYKPQRD